MSILHAARDLYALLIRVKRPLKTDTKVTLFLPQLRDVLVRSTIRTMYTCRVSVRAACVRMYACVRACVELFTRACVYGLWFLQKIYIISLTVVIITVDS